jgi:thiopeptide-type bacteriocin biosynthesis protein
VELVVPLVRGADPAARPSPSSSGVVREAAPPVAWPDAARRRPPGSDWLYVALDGPSRTEDALVTGSLGDLMDAVVARGDASGWFFVRYADPDRQLRLRVHGDPEVLVRAVLPELTAWAASAIGAGTRTRMSLQTYDRELERYGGPEALEVCEAVACVDSAAVRQLLGAVPRASVPGEDWRLDVALTSLAGLIASLAGDDRAEQARWATSIGSGVTEAGAVFRQRKDRLRSLVHHGVCAGAEAVAGDRVAEVLAWRHHELAPLVAELTRLRADGVATVPLRDVASSLVHLHANRLGLDTRAERLALGLLDRALRSLVAHPRQ